MGDLRRGAFDADLGAEINRELPGRYAGLGKVIDRHDPADTHVDRGELFELDHAARTTGSWASRSRPAPAWRSPGLGRSTAWWSSSPSGGAGSSSSAVEGCRL